MPKEERYGITAQSRKAAFSSAANIVEGAAKRGRGEFRRFLDISLGSLAELEYWLLVIRDLELLPVDVCNGLSRLHRDANRVTWNLYKKVAPRRNPSSRLAA